MLAFYVPVRVGEARTAQVTPIHARFVIHPFTFNVINALEVIHCFALIVIYLS